MDKRYPKSLKKSRVLALLSDKNPERFERETKYLEEHGLLKTVKTEVPIPIGLIPVSLTIAVKLLITAKGIDALKETGEREKYAEKRERVERPVAFISASFDDGADPMIKWVINRAENAGFTTIWLKEIYRARPTVDKIDEAICDSDCMIQVLTSHVFEKHGEAGWIGNEAGMAFKSNIHDKIAVFVQKGHDATGLTKLLTDVFYVDPNNLAQYERKAEEYLSDLISRSKPSGEE